MADFSPPWASEGGVNRSPSVDEQNDGFECGSADMTLFNRLIGRIEAELEAIQTEGGIAGSEGDDTTVLQAIQAMISAATGGGDTSEYVLFSQAQARIPIFPEVTTNNGVIAVTSPSTGTVRVPASAVVLHRGIRTYTSAETDFATVLSKTYHLRFQVAAGVGTYVLKDLADVAYNPTVAAEDNAAFDSTYDDMLVARIVTNSSNVATITNLINKDRLSHFDAPGRTTSGVTVGTSPYGPGSIMKEGNTFTYNFARTPTMQSIIAIIGASFASTIGVEGAANGIYNKVINRYSTVFDVATDYKPGATGGYVEIEFRATA